MQAIGIRQGRADDVARTRADLLRVVSEQLFSTVFQPIVRVQDRKTVGFEALTRFHEGQAPAVVFDTAIRCGIGHRVEAAAVRRALAEATRLPAGTWVSVNVSPPILGRCAGLKPLLATADRPVVLELTEREPVDDYDAIRRSLRSLAGARLAVDDTGSGFASLRHVVELRPSFVKVDRGWVDGVAHDACRQATLRGLRALAESTHATVVAEGVERPGDLEALAVLGVPFAQGFLLGEPAAAQEWG